MRGANSYNGFKDVIHAWKAERRDPDKLLALYNRAGAPHFSALANHHDNFDSEYLTLDELKAAAEHRKAEIKLDEGTLKAAFSCWIIQTRFDIS